MKTDEELKKTFTISVNEKESIIKGALLIEVGGAEDNARQVILIEEIILKTFKQNPNKKYKILLDLLPLGKGKVYTSSENRKSWARLAFNKQIEKCAVVGESIILKAIATFVIRLSGRSDDIKWFFNKEEALKWLKE